MKKTILVDIITYFFILLFVYTGVAKLMEIHLVKEQLLSAPLLGSPVLANSITWALPIGELLLAIMLFIPKFQLKGLYITLALMSLFTIYVMIILFMDNHLSCSCGGIIEELSPKQHVLFNSACIVLCGVAIAIRRRQESTRRFRWVTNTSAIGLFAIVGWTLFTAFSAPATIKTGMEGRLLPAFDLLLTDSATHLNTADIPTGKPFIVIGFSPWCTHCQAETRDIIKHMQELKDTRIYYVTAFPFGQMKAFYGYFKLAQYPNIVMGRDLKNYFLSYFKATGVPYTAIFDSKKRLKQVLGGETKADLLAKLVAEN
jgi:thiol-disulfide isomerase/thioredoxin